ncbi:MAG: zf-HC2 domain-containing protein [Lachnospiraceae bacterium]|nr:zf-HC2 domain-containing protein [Lachnospiraceae bacterium]
MSNAVKSQKSQKKPAQDTCKRMQALIPGYLEKSLTLHDAREFTEHLKSCSVCRDEIEISYLLKEGISRAEMGETIDLHTDLEDMLDETENTIQYLTQYNTAVHLIEGTAVFVLLACALLLFMI